MTLYTERFLSASTLITPTQWDKIRSLTERFDHTVVGFRDERPVIGIHAPHEQITELQSVYKTEHVDVEIVYHRDQLTEYRCGGVME